MLTFAFMHYPYLVCILFGMPSLHLFTFLMFFKSFIMMITVTAKIIITITATTPPMMASVLSAVVVEVHCGSPSVDDYGTASVHIQTQTLYNNGGVCLHNKRFQICYQL